MANVLVALIDKADLWVINILVLTVGALIIVWVFSTLTVLKKNISSQATSDRLLSLQEEYNKVNSDCIAFRDKYNQSIAIKTGIKSTHAELKYLFSQFADRQDIQGQAYGILKLITDRLSTDLKFFAGEIHRCAVWLKIDDRNLGLHAASAGFPDNYRNHRALEIDRSVAGRCFRTRTSIYSPNVFNDRDFIHNPHSPHNYKSLICVPLVLGDVCFGVITIDGKEENAFKTEDIETVEVYAEMAAMVYMMQIASTMPHIREEDTHEDNGNTEDE